MHVISYVEMSQTHDSGAIENLDGERDNVKLGSEGGQ